MAGPKNNWQDSAQDHRAFLLRCWQEEKLENWEEPGQSFTWRFCLVKSGDKQTQRAFANLESLVAYLRQELSAG